MGSALIQNFSTFQNFVHQQQWINRLINQNMLKLDTFSPKFFLNYLNQLGSQNLKRFEILWSGERMWFKYETWLKMWWFESLKVNRGSPVCAKPFIKLGAHIEGEQNGLWRKLLDFMHLKWILTHIVMKF